MKLRRLCLVGLLFGLSSQLAAKEPMQVDIHELPKISHTLLGQEITTRGCLTATLHGDFIAPCRYKDWRELVLAYETDGVTVSPPMVISYGVTEGDFMGVVEELPITWPKPGKRMFLRIEKIVNAKRFEP